MGTCLTYDSISSRKSSKQMAQHSPTDVSAKSKALKPCSRKVSRSLNGVSNVSAWQKGMLPGMMRETLPTRQKVWMRYQEEEIPDEGGKEE